MAAGVYALSNAEIGDFIARRLALHRVDGRETVFQLGDGRWMQVETHTMQDASVIHVWTDISEIKTAEAQQRVLEEQLRQSQRLQALGTLAGGMAHELNNALLPALVYSKQALQRADDDTPERRQMERMYAASRRGCELVKQVLAFSRQEQAEYEIIDLAAVVGDAIESLTPLTPPNIALDATVGEACTIRGDAEQLRGVVVNLVTNACQAIGDEQGTVSVNLARHHSDSERDTWVARLSVSDTGSGMDEQTRERIFEPFFTTRPVGQGTGLGLAVVHGTVQAHGATIVVRSKPNEGTVFQIDFPAIDDAKHRADAVSRPL